jgi:tRNA(Ile)-lysidine synthase
MAKGLKLPFYYRKLPAGYLRRMRGSIQESARRQRYLFLEEIRDQWDFQKIAMGHQADDQAETVLAAILRGAGTHGLGGMPYIRGGTLIRPLVDVTRQEILTYLDVHSIPFRRDPSNEDLSYKRNQIRHELLPLLRERFNPRINERLRQTARVCAMEDAYLENQTEELWAEAAVSKEDGVELPLDQYLDRPKALRYRLLRMACVHMQEGKRKPSMVHLDELDRIVKEAREEKWLHLPGGIRCVVGGGSLVIGRVEAFSAGSIHYAVRLPGETLVREANVRIRWEISEGKPPNGWPDRHDIAYMDLEALRGDVLVDRQVPRRERWRVPIVVDDLGVVWVVGHRLDERVRIRPETQRMLKATLLPLSL